MAPSRELALRHPNSIAHVSVHAPAPARKALIFSVFVALHSVAVKVCMDTSGDAYEVAVQRVRKINREHHLNGTKPEDLPPQDPLPSTWAPNPWASAALFASVSLHALFHLLCHWKVSFRAAALYRPATSVREGCYLQVTTHAHRGRPAMVPVWLSDASVRLSFVFQRQHYEYWDEDELEKKRATQKEDGSSPVDDHVGEVRLVRCPVDKDLSFYLGGVGLKGGEHVDELKEHFGDNVLEVEMPNFLQCYKEQLLTPLVIFQVFVALLWAADDFVQYTLMQLAFILIFESTSVFQRLRTMKMLNSMGTKSYGIKVFRGAAWIDVSTTDLLPGDLVELMATPPKPRVVAKETGAAPPPPLEEKVAPDIVPCDCVIIRGEAVASEASLTGESAPQMKDALRLEARELDMNGVDRVHCLFSGTRLLRATEGADAPPRAARTPTGTPTGMPTAAGAAAGAAASNGPVSPATAAQVPGTPGGGCLCFVLRTGFASSQGELLQLIEFSQEKVSGDTKEVLLALLVLLVFALIAAGYVLKTGLEKGDKTPHELLIKCVIILTAVVPQQLPMQMAVAVNTALMSLLKAGVYCTEPFRVPLAGKLTHCLFDKTGTLTTDTLLPVGVVNAEGACTGAGGCPSQVAVSDASPAAALVLATCHSLVSVEEQLTGDPIEMAALRGVGWKYDAETETTRPAEMEPDSQEGAWRPKPRNASLESARIVQRFHFASHLQRMAVVADVAAGSHAGSLQGSGCYALVKGSPEALHPLLAPNAAPPWFERAHKELAERGLRVLALAYRRLKHAGSRGAAHSDLARDEVECELSFAGFIAFECLSRADSTLVVGALRESDHQVGMLTGDSPLTALHIARVCGIAEFDKPGLVLRAVPEAAEGKPAVVWEVATGDRRGDQRPLSVSVADLADSYALIAVGDALDLAVSSDPSFWESVDRIKVFARMTPQGKGTVIRELQKQGRHVLMCGDGGNDVGALKQADVGLALLAGYGNVNTTGVKLDATAPAGPEPEKKSAELALNERQTALMTRSKEAGKARQKFLWDKQKELNNLHKTWLQEEVDARAARGENSFMANAMAVKSVLARYTAELKREMKEYDQRNGNIYDGEGKEQKPEDPAEKMKSALESSAESAGLPMVRPGDASVAAPFTSKAPSVKNCVDLIRQGRCTLLSALQQQQIMMLNCIINAYVLSALSLEGSRSSERQMMASHWLLTTASLAFAYASPCDRMHSVRPLRSLFHPAVFGSMLGQAAIHLACMVMAVRMARTSMEEDSAARQAGWSGPSLKDVSEFWRLERLKRRGYIESEEKEQDWTQMAMQMWTQPFLPNLMNTIVFLVETAQTCAILFVNYKGQPWMKGVLENRALFLSVFIVAGSVAAAAWELSPELNGLIHLSPFPNEQFRWGIMGLVGATFAGTLLWDRLCVALFAPEIFRATVESAKATTFRNDILPIFKTAGKVLAVFLLLGTGNLLIIGGAFFWYKRSTREVDV